jgi:hypothetical protein
VPSKLRGQAAVRSIFAHADLPACRLSNRLLAVNSMAWQSIHLSSCTCRARFRRPTTAWASPGNQRSSKWRRWVEGKPQYRPWPLFAARCLLRLERALRPHPQPAHACYCMFRPRGAESQDCVQLRVVASRFLCVPRLDLMPASHRQKCSAAPAHWLVGAALADTRSELAALPSPR